MLKINHLYKSYEKKEVLKDINLVFANTGLVVILGKSGSGKTTLLNILSGYEKPTSGEVLVEGKSLNLFEDKDFDDYRSNYASYIFQDSYLLDDMSINDNIDIILSEKNKDNNLKINKALEKVGLDNIGHKICKDLSGGQRQRVNIARSLVKNNRVIFADEPTGSLDANNSEEIFSLLKDIAKEKLVIVVTHSKELANKYASRIIEIKDGVIISDKTRVNKPKNINLNNYVVKVENGSKITKEDIESFVKDEEKYIGVTDNLEKLVVAHPDLLEYKENISNVFADTKSQNEECKEYVHTENKLSNKQILKLSKSSKLYKKKYNLLLAFLILFASFLIVSINLSSLNLPNYISKNHRNNLLEVSKINQRITNDEIQNIENIANNANSGYLINYKLSPVFATSNDDSDLFSPAFTGIIENNNFNYSLKYGSDDYKSNYEIVISDYMASLFIEYGVLTREKLLYALDYSDLIGEEIYICETGEYYKIIGIYKTDYFELLKSYLINGNDHKQIIVDNIDFIYSKIFAKQDFYKQYKMDYKDLYFYQDNEIFVTNLISESKPYTFYFSDTRVLLNKKKVSDANLYDLEGNKIDLPDELNDNEIIISINCLYEMFKESDIKISELIKRNDINDVLKDTELKLNILRNNAYGEDVKILNNINIKIVGVLDKGSRIFVSNDIYNYIENSLSGYDSVYISNDYSQVRLKSLLSKIYDNGYYFGTNTFKCENAISFESASQIIKNVFMILTCVSFVFVMLLSLNYLTIIIRLRRKEFALYRSYGIRKFDIYKIFSIEVIKLSIKAIVIGSILSFALSKLLNNIFNSLELISDYASNIINISLINILFIFVAILVTMLLVSYLVLVKVLNTSALKLLKEE